VERVFSRLDEEAAFRRPSGSQKSLAEGLVVGLEKKNSIRADQGEINLDITVAKARKGKMIPYDGAMK